jgi:hypothetical protein
MSTSWLKKQGPILTFLIEALCKARDPRGVLFMVLRATVEFDSTLQPESSFILRGAPYCSLAC